jgi:hypothetical protein
MARFAIVDNKTKVVSNVVVWEGNRWMSVPGTLVIHSDTAGIGDVYDEKTNAFIKQPEPVEQG